MIPITLNKIRKKPDEPVYLAREAGRNFELSENAMAKYAQYYRETNGLIADWLRTLPKEERSEIKTIS